MTIPPSLRRNKKEIIFAFVGIALVIIMALLFINTISFLTSKVDSALEVTSGPASSVHFRLSDLPTLGIIPVQESVSNDASSTQ